MTKQKALFKQTVKEGNFTLPCGLLTEDGERIKDVLLTPLTVEDRKKATDNNSKNMGKIVSELLLARIKKLGGQPPTPIQMRELLLFDREFLMLKLWEVSNPGKELEPEFKCSCGETFSVNLPVDDIEIREMPEDTPVDTKTGHRYWDFKNEEFSSSARMRFVDGGIQEALSPTMRKSMAEGEQKLLVKMVLEWFGPEGSAGTLTLPEVKTFPLGLVVAFEDEVGKHKYGPDFSLKVTCPECESDMDGVFNIVNFLLGA